MWSPYASNTVQLMYVCISFNVQDIKLHLLIKMKLVFPYIMATTCGKSSIAIKFTWVTIPGPATCDVKTSVALKIKYRSSHKLQTDKTVLAAPCPPARPPDDPDEESGRAQRWVGGPRGPEDRCCCCCFQGQTNI